jgi:hypothetical protein
VPGVLSLRLRHVTLEFWAGRLAGFGACLILSWVIDRHRRPRQRGRRCQKHARKPLQEAGYQAQGRGAQ